MRRPTVSIYLSGWQNCVSAKLCLGLDLRFRTHELNLFISHEKHVFCIPFLCSHRSVDPNGIEDLRSICKIALQAYDSEKEKSHDRSRAVHHPFAFPTTSLMDSGYPMEPSDVRKELTDLPESPGIGNERLAPITAVARQLHNRFHADAENWVGVTNPPPNEKYTGVVIMVDNASREMDPAILNEYIPQEVTSISILASPLCLYSTPLETGSSCLGYVDELFGYFNSAYGTALSGNGPDGGPGVTSKIIPSTAAGMARPMTTNTLLCPPHTLSCLPAALGKVPQLEEPDPPIPNPPLPTTILFDVPESVAAASFVDKIGRCGAANYGGACIRVIQLATTETSQTVTGTPDAPVPEPVQDTPSGEPAAEDFSTAQEPADYEGFVTTDPSYSNPAPTPPTGGNCSEDRVRCYGRFHRGNCFSCSYSCSR